MATANTNGLLHSLKRLGYLMPQGIQTALKQRLNAYRISRGTFRSIEPEWDRLSEWIKPGDTVIDIGANVGFYALRMAELVGPSGLVIAFEPIAETFRLLAQNVSRCSNVTLINAAVSDCAARVSMTIPTHLNLPHASRAHIASSGQSVLALTLDSLNLPPVSFVKIDVEGHELPALQGASNLLRRCKPRLVIEDNDPRVSAFMTGLGYTSQRQEGSPNVVYA